MATELKIFDEDSRGRCAEFISSLNSERKWTVEIKRTVKRRSLSQNSWLWLTYETIAAETGHTKDDIHEIICRKFLPPRVVVGFDGEETLVYSSKNLTTLEWKTFMEEYMAWAATDMGWYLPHPDDRGRDA